MRSEDGNVYGHISLTLISPTEAVANIPDTYDFFYGRPYNGVSNTIANVANIVGETHADTYSMPNRTPTDFNIQFQGIGTIKPLQYLFGFITLSIILTFSFIARPISQERAAVMAKDEFSFFCIESRFDCSEFSIPEYSTTNDNGYRIFITERFIQNTDQTIRFEIRIPSKEWDDVQIGTINSPELIKRHLFMNTKS
ncbi:hypothetical protein PN836_005695 [Ningiella sp. W23]|uniref:hypothetical protein n=1 Tax=Ningiella sp. W23 TaxID=3023715 RepID=UPI00375791C0